MWREIPALYDVAKQVCHEYGLSWTDPRTGKTHKPPKARTKKLPSGRKPVARRRARAK